MKKLFVLLLFLALAKNVFALDLTFSAGGGGLLGYTFTRYTMEGGDVVSNQSMDRFNFAGFLFFDATYVVFSVMFQGGSNSYSERITTGGTLADDLRGTGSEASLGFSLMGKYPFTINERITWFPMLGVEYHIALRQLRQREGIPIVYSRPRGELVEDRDKNGNPFPLSAWNSFWINIGAGLDYTISGPLFLRTELLFGFRLPTRYETGALEAVQDRFDISSPRLRGLTGSPTLKVGIGYRF